MHISWNDSDDNTCFVCFHEIASPLDLVFHSAQISVTLTEAWEQIYE